MKPEEIRQILESTADDVTFESKQFDEPAVMYLDEGSCQVWTDQNYVFDSWYDMLKEPVFWGKTLDQVADTMRRT